MSSQLFASSNLYIAQELITPKLARQMLSMPVFVRLNHCGVCSGDWVCCAFAHIYQNVKYFWQIARGTEYSSKAWIICVSQKLFEFLPDPKFWYLSCSFPNDTHTHVLIRICDCHAMIMRDADADAAVVLKPLGIFFLLVVKFVCQPIRKVGKNILHEKTRVWYKINI